MKYIEISQKVFFYHNLFQLQKVQILILFTLKFDEFICILNPDKYLNPLGVVNPIWGRVENIR